MNPTRKNIKRAMHSLQNSDDKLLAGTVEMNLAIAYRVLGDFDTALASFQRARSHLEEVGDLARLAELHHHRGVTLFLKGAWEESLEAFELSSALSVRCNRKNLRGLAHLGKAYSYYSMGDIAAASMLAEQALECFSLCDDRGPIAELYKLKGMICREKNQCALALWYLSTSLRIHLELDHPAEAGGCYYELSKLYAAQQNLTASRRALKKSLTYFQRVGNRNDILRVQSEVQAMEGERP
jgi:tetratricopeptide (TPR) repeat protein